MKWGLWSVEFFQGLDQNPVQFLLSVMLFEYTVDNLGNILIVPKKQFVLDTSMS